MTKQRKSRLNKGKPNPYTSRRKRLQVLANGLKVLAAGLAAEEASNKAEEDEESDQQVA